MADFLGNDIFLIPILSLFTCLAFTRFYFLSFLLLHLSFGKHMHIMHALLHSCTLWSLLAEFFVLLHVCSWDQVKLSSSLVYPCTFHFLTLPFYCIPFRLSCRIGEDFYILALITFISKIKPINSFSQTLT